MFQRSLRLQEGFRPADMLSVPFKKMLIWGSLSVSTYIYIYIHLFYACLCYELSRFASPTARTLLEAEKPQETQT